MAWFHKQGFHLNSFYKLFLEKTKTVLVYILRQNNVTDIFYDKIFYLYFMQVAFS